VTNGKGGDRKKLGKRKMLERKEEREKDGLPLLGKRLKRGGRNQNTKNGSEQ